jgi:hypothetical protein
VSWSQHHPVIKPKAIWSSNEFYNKPMLQMSTLTMAFAAAIGTMELTTLQFVTLIAIAIVIVNRISTEIVLKKRNLISIC